MNGKDVQHFIALMKPVSYESDYLTIEKQLSLSLDEEITLEPEDFEKFVMDNWKWKNSFTITTSGYKMQG